GVRSWRLLDRQSFLDSVGAQWLYSHARELLGNYRRQSQETRLELRLVSTVDSKLRTIWIADARRCGGKHFVVPLGSARDSAILPCRKRCLLQVRHSSGFDAGGLGSQVFKAVLE